MKEYLAVEWGNNIRIAHSKVEKDKEAAEQCYGSAYPDMVIYRLGADKKIATKKFNEILKAKKELTAR